VRERAAALAAAAGITIEHIGKKHVRKEAVVTKVLEARGEHPGLVHIISAMEGCDSYKPWHDKQTHKTYLRPDSGQCPHDSPHLSFAQVLRRFAPIPYQIREFRGMSLRHGHRIVGTARWRTAEGHPRVH
jgi:hypothetical protein